MTDAGMDVTSNTAGAVGALNEAELDREVSASSAR